MSKIDHTTQRVDPAKGMLLAILVGALSGFVVGVLVAVPVYHLIGCV